MSFCGSHFAFRSSSVVNGRYDKKKRGRRQAKTGEGFIFPVLNEKLYVNLISGIFLCSTYFFVRKIEDDFLIVWLCTLNGLNMSTTLRT